MAAPVDLNKSLAALAAALLGPPRLTIEEANAQGYFTMEQIAGTRSSKTTVRRMLAKQKGKWEFVWLQGHNIQAWRLKRG